MSAGRGCPLSLLLWIVLLTAPFPSQSSFAVNCPPVAAKDAAERRMMEMSSNHRGCWVRDANTGLLEFISNEAPNKSYKPLIRAQPPTPPEERTPVLAHGPTNPSLYALIVGTWRGSFCGLNLGTLRIDIAGSVLTGAATIRSVVEEQECDSSQGDVCLEPPAPTRTCNALDLHLTSGTPVQHSLTNGGFDGQVLWLGVAGKHGPDIQFRFSKQTLTVVGDPRKPPTVFHRVQ